MLDFCCHGNGYQKSDWLILLCHQKHSHSSITAKCAFISAGTGPCRTFSISTGVLQYFLPSPQDSCKICFYREKIATKYCNFTKLSAKTHSRTKTKSIICLQYTIHTIRHVQYSNGVTVWLHVLKRVVNTLNVHSNSVNKWCAYTRDKLFLPRWLRWLRHSAHWPGWSIGGAGVQSPGSAGRFHVRISGAHALRLIFRAGKEDLTVSSIICDRWLILG